MLTGKRAVTHWRFCDRLARKYPEVTICPDLIYSRDRSIYTSASTTAGIDLSLTLVEEDHGHQTALENASTAALRRSHFHDIGLVPAYSSHPSLL
ncbi:MAG TPA: hypothetical protein VHN81_12310 [Edaphobacter sp.]|nr:hypothetical protein [Edaphobacter sp.]